MFFACRSIAGITPHYRAGLRRVRQAGKNSKIQVVYLIAFTFATGPNRDKIKYLRILFYNIFLFLYRLALPLAAPFNSKARKWVQGRKNIFSRLAAAIPAGDKIIWVHCASLGEFEQGRPVIEKLRALNSGHKILLTFFSPSGYEVQQHYSGADWVFYLPMDGPVAAKRFIQITHPSLVIFVKYEFWYYYLKKIKYSNIPFLLISAQLKKDSSFLKVYGGLLKKMISRFDHLFVQNQASKEVVDEMGLANNCTVSGDTRFDRVAEIAERAEPLPLIEAFTNNQRTIVAGSTWREDEAVLQKAMSIIDDAELKLIIAPHEIDEKHLAFIKGLFPAAILYSELKANPALSNSRILIIDNFGMLSRLYQYGYLAYVGGGLTTNGVHNVLEAAVYHKIVLFGPYYHDYSEAIGLVQTGGGISFMDEKRDGVMLAQLVEVLLKNKDDYAIRSKEAGEFVQSNRGATQKIMDFIQEKRLLTN